MKRSRVFPAVVLAAAVLAASFILGACSGGGGGGSAPPPKPQLSGTVASGGALIGATITLKDSLGTILTATTDSNGLYSIDTTGLTPPYLLLATKSSNTFYSVSADTNTTSVVNITPLTDLIVRTWYEVQGGTVEAAFADPTIPGNEPPSPTVVAVISSVVKNLVQLWLNAAGVATDSFNLISTPFTADHSGIDLVLDNTIVDTSTGLVTISSGTVTQSSTLTAGTGSMTVVTLTTSASGSSTSTNGTIVPVLTAEQDALAGITTTVNNFAAKVNARGSALVGSDLQPYMDPDAAVIWGGMTQAQTAAQIAFFFKGTTVSFSNIMIKSMPTATTAETTFKLSQSVGGQTNTETISFFFRKVGGTWLMSGNNRIAEIEVRALMVRNQGSGGGGSPSLNLEVNVNALRSNATTTSLLGATIAGGPWGAGTPLSYGGQNEAFWDSSLTTDSYSTNVFGATGIAGGDLFTIGVTPASGVTVTYTQALNAITTEPIMITSGLTGTTIASANLGSPQTVTWTLPTTFAIQQVRLGTVANSGPPNDPLTIKCDDAGSQNVLGITATSATVIIQATCGGLPTLSAEVYLQVYGINGELTTVYYTYDY